VRAPFEVPLIRIVAPTMGRLSSVPLTVPVIVFCCAVADSKNPQNRKNKNRSFLITLNLGLVNEQMESTIFYC
jgi:hypothetical protein